MADTLRDVIVFDLEGCERRIREIIDRPTIIVLVRYFG